MVNIAQGKFQQLVGQNAPSVCESKQGMIRKDCAETHGAGVQYSFVAEATETGVSMYYFDFFSECDIAKYREERKDCGECGLAVYYEKRDVIDLETIGEVSYSCTAPIRMSNDDHFVAAVDQLCGQLVDVTLNSSWLREEEVADHGDVIRHFETIMESIFDYIESARTTSGEFWRASS